MPFVCQQDNLLRKDCLNVQQQDIQPLSLSSDGTGIPGFGTIWPRIGAHLGVCTGLVLLGTAVATQCPIRILKETAP
jgi:hypothetical protein